MDNPATDPNAKATIELITAGSNIPLVFINAYGLPISNEGKVAAQFGFIHNPQLDTADNPDNSLLNRIPAQLAAASFSPYYLAEIEVRIEGSQGRSKTGYDFEPKVPTNTTIIPTVRLDNTTECLNMEFSFIDGGEQTETNVRRVKEADEAVLGMPEEDDWVMHGPLSDKTLMRNVLAHHLSDQMSRRYAPKTRWAEVFLTSTGNGFPGVYEYQGTYVFTEKMEVDRNRVNIAKPSRSSRPDNTMGFGYLFEVDRSDNLRRDGVASNFTSTGQNLTVEFLYIDPHSDEVRDFRLTDYINQVLGNFETVLSRLQEDDPLSVLESQIDVDSFVDFFLFTELAKTRMATAGILFFTEMPRHVGAESLWGR